MRSYLMKLMTGVALAAALAPLACRTVDEGSLARAAATGVPKADPAAVAFLGGASAQVLFDAFDVPESTDKGLVRKEFAGDIVVSCSRSGKDVFYCAMNQQGSNKFLFSLDKEAALDFYASFRIAEKTMGPISTKTFDGIGAVKCQYAAGGADRQGFYCDLTGEGSVGPVAELTGSDAQALYQALKLPEVAAAGDKQKAKSTTASIYIRCAKYDGNKHHCVVKTGQVSLAVVKGDAALALFNALRAPEETRGAKTLKEFQGNATIACREQSCEVGFARLEGGVRKNP